MTVKTLPGRHCPFPEQPFNKRQFVGVVVGLTGVVVGVTGAVVGLTGVVVGLTGAVVGLTGDVVGLTGVVVGVTGAVVGLTGVVVGLVGVVAGLTGVVVGLIEVRGGYPSKQSLLCQIDERVQKLKKKIKLRCTLFLVLPLRNSSLISYIFRVSN